MATGQTTTVRCYAVTRDRLKDEMNGSDGSLADTAHRMLEERDELQQRVEELERQLSEQETTPGGV